MLRDIKVLHLEPTDVCQAACPLCARETDPAFRKDQRHHLDMDQITRVFDADRIAALDKMFMCGNYGDPAAGRHTLDIYRHFRLINPGIVLGMNTNGGIQNTSWWYNLGEIFHNARDYVVFSIDGLEDTNHWYRRGVDWNKMIKNIQSYISTGAIAHWDMLVYRHNEHQVDACEQLARDMGFRWFRAKVSRRPLVADLQTPLGWQMPTRQIKTIDCHALREQSIYIDAQGRVSPCCWLSNRQKDFVTDFEEIKQSWSGPNPNAVCLATCGTDGQHTNFSNQWQREVEFDV